MNRRLNHAYIFMKQIFSGNFTSVPLKHFLPCANVHKQILCSFTWSNMQRAVMRKSAAIRRDLKKFMFKCCPNIFSYALDTGRKLNIRKTFRRFSGRSIYVLCQGGTSCVPLQIYISYKSIIGKWFLMTNTVTQKRNSVNGVAKGITRRTYVSL